MCKCVTCTMAVYVQWTQVKTAAGGGVSTLEIGSGVLAWSQ